MGFRIKRTKKKNQELLNENGGGAGMARAARRDPLAEGGALAFARACRFGLLAQIVEPRYCVGSNPTLGLQRKYGGGGMSSQGSQFPPPSPFLRVVLLYKDLVCSKKWRRGRDGTSGPPGPARRRRRTRVCSCVPIWATRPNRRTQVLRGFEPHLRSTKKIRRGWDSNPRYQSPGITIFETVPFNRSGTPPRFGKAFVMGKAVSTFTNVEIGF
jgi:hypothetical protein